MILSSFTRECTYDTHGQEKSYVQLQIMRRLYFTVYSCSSNLFEEAVANPNSYLNLN